MKFIRLLFIILLIGMTSLACLGTRIQNPASSLIFSDDFSKTDKKWDQVDEATRTTEYYNDSYRIIVNDINSDVWANPGRQNFSDTQIEVDATKNGGPDDNDFGIICRYNDKDGYKFYYGVISSDGYYGIMKMTNDGGKLIGEDHLLENENIILGSATNKIRFDCVGSTLTLYVNNTKIDQQSDDEYTTGNIGLVAGTFDTTGTDIVFDNFYVFEP